MNDLNSNLDKISTSAEVQDNSNLIKQDQTKLNSENTQHQMILDRIQEGNKRKQAIYNERSQQWYDDLSCKNHIVSIHNACIKFANNKGIQFWKSSDSLTVYYRVNAFGKKQKLNKDSDLYSVLGTFINVYDSIKDIEFHDNTLILIAEYLTPVNADLFYPKYYIEWIDVFPHIYRNTFELTFYLTKRHMVQRRNQLENINYTPTLMIQPQQNVYPLSSIYNISGFVYNEDNSEVDYLNNQLRIYDSFIENFIGNLLKTEDQFYYLTDWLISYFQTLHKPNTVLVLIGDKKSTELLVNHIIKPLFAKKDEYFYEINNDNLPKEKVVKNKIFYYVNNLSEKYAKEESVSEFVLQALQSKQFIDYEDPIFIPSIIVTSSQDSPYPFLEDSYSQCTVLKVRDLKSIIRSMNVPDRITLNNNIKNDLLNFATSLAQWDMSPQFTQPGSSWLHGFQYVLHTEEKDALKKMKNGLLITQSLIHDIDTFIEAIRNKNLNFFTNIKNIDMELYQELERDFKENKIAQPLLSKYFNIVFDDEVFSKNNDLIELLKEKSEMFNKKLNDDSKYKGKKRYEIS